MAARANIAVGAVLAVVVLAALALVAAPGLLPGASGGGAGIAGLRALVHDADGKVHELPLSEDAELVVSTGLGTNVVVVEGGAVSVREADCDGLDCVKQGAIDAPGMQIICLPHKLWVEVVAADGQSGQMDMSAAAGAAGEFDAVAR